MNTNAEDKKTLEIVKSKVSEKKFAMILLELEDGGYCYDFKIASKAKGEHQGDDDLDVYVDQTTDGGYSGDEFAGTCSIKISENEYFQYSYSM